MTWVAEFCETLWSLSQISKKIFLRILLCVLAEMPNFGAENNTLFAQPAHKVFELTN